MLPYWNYANEAFIQNIWPDAAHIDPTVFEVVMRTANSVCEAYAPALSENAQIPDNYKLAEIFQARDIWSKFNGGAAQTFGADDLNIPVYPLVFVARDLLRPKTSALSRLF